ncbi:hypothetical protein ES703_50383 [subsurface metagenome]
MSACSYKDIVSSDETYDNTTKKEIVSSIRELEFILYEFTPLIREKVKYLQMIAKSG